jgi:hypothetical protein
LAGSCRELIDTAGTKRILAFVHEGEQFIAGHNLKGVMGRIGIGSDVVGQSDDRVLLCVYTGQTCRDQDEKQREAVERRKNRCVKAII